MRNTSIKTVMRKVICLVITGIMLLSLGNTVMATIHPSTALGIDESGVEFDFCDNWEDDFESGTVMLYLFENDEPVVQEIPAELLDEAILEHMGWDGLSEFVPPVEPHEVEVMYYFGWDSIEPQIMSIEEFYQSIYPDLYIEAGILYSNGNEMNVDDSTAFGIMPLNAATLNLSTSSWTSSFNASSTTIQVTSNAQWTVNDGNLGWVRVENITPANRTGNGSFRLTTFPNPGVQPRSGTITVTAPGAPTRTITVTQQAHPPTLSLSTSSWNPTSAVSSAVVTISANGTWSITSNQSWLTITHITPGTRTGGGFFTMNVTANTSASTRTGTVTVSLPGVPARTVTVTQAAHQANLAVSSSGWTLQTHHSSQSTVNVTSNGNWTVSSNATSWLTVSRSSGSGNGSFVMSATENTGSSTRNGTITVTGGGVTRTIPVSQAAQAGSLSLSLTTWTPSHTADSISVNVFSNGQWTVSSNATSWLTVTPASNTGNRPFTISVTANTGASARSGTITVTGGGVTRTVSVTQSAQPAQAATLNLSQSTWNPASVASNVNITVTSNRTWSVSSNATSWLTVSPSSGANNGAFTINATANTGSTSRTGTITVTAPGATTRTISVIQAAAVNVTVTFNANGGTGGPTARTVLAGSQVGALTPDPSRIGHTFGGWFTAQTGGVQVSASTVVNGNITYWARWNTRINLNANGGVGVPSYIIQQSGTSHALPAPTRDGYIFLGWSLTPQVTSLDAGIYEGDLNDLYISGFNQAYIEENLEETTVWDVDAHDAYAITPANISFIVGALAFNGQMTVHAHWVRAHIVTFNPNGGELMSHQLTQRVTDNTAVGTLPTPTRSGYAFMGWYSTLTGSDTEVFHSEVIRNNRTFHARWMITVTFNPNGGEMPSGQESRQVISGYPLVMPSQPIRVGATTGRRKTGWFTAVDGGNEVPHLTFAPNSNVTYHARWVLNIDLRRHLTYWTHSNNITILSTEINVDPIVENAWTRGIGSGISGANSWNSSSAPVNFTVSPTSLTSRNRVIVEEHRNRPDVLGWAQNGVLGFRINWFEIVLNSYAIENLASWEGYNLQHVITSVMVHELGHTIGLEDGFIGNPHEGYINSSIMNQDRSRGTLYRPTQFDIVSLSYIYD
ncbi:MAG: InlB B-repeat-containing protein [Defluviitaleaceae bacterium]|nr:InlB B-repeat-containing protein [Defluviitaleaceae bacterium]